MVVTVEREIERIEKFFLYGHYDSRGGATGIVARNQLEALRAYADVFDPEGLRRYVAEREGAAAAERAYDNAIDAAADDFVHLYELRVADEPLPAEDTELLGEYGGAGYCFGVVQTRYWRAEYDHEGNAVEGKGAWSKWADTDVAVVWKGKKPGVTVGDTVLKEQARIAKRDVGEDAFGLVLQRVPPSRDSSIDTDGRREALPFGSQVGEHVAGRMAKRSQPSATKALVSWLTTVLEAQCRDGVVELPSGEEAEVRFDAALQTVSLHAFGDEESLLARVRLVVD